jgi:ribose transport system substrate-binding protein
LRPVPKTTLVISFDTIQPGPELLKEGRVQILIGQKYFGWGEEPVKMLAGIKAGKMPPETIVDSGVDVVRQDNVDAYVAAFKRLEEGR